MSALAMTNCTITAIMAANDSRYLRYRLASDHQFKTFTRPAIGRCLHKKSIFCTKSSPLMGLYVQSYLEQVPRRGSRV